MVPRHPCSVCAGELAYLVGRPGAARLYPRGCSVGLSAPHAGICGPLRGHGHDPTRRRSTMKLRIAVAALLMLGGVESQSVLAQDMEERRPKFELGIGAWISTGETKWAHNASSIPGLGNPTSKLTYKDVGTNIIDLTGKVWFTPRLFGRLNLGIGNVGGGRLTDDDYGSGQRLFSETNSDIDGVSTWYLNADFGGKVKEFANHRGYLEVFGGYQYWYTKYNAVGLSQVACDPTAIPGLGCPPLGPVSNVAPRQSVITNTAN